MLYLKARVISERTGIKLALNKAKIIILKL